MKTKSGKQNSQSHSSEKFCHSAFDGLPAGIVRVQLNYQTEKAIMTDLAANDGGQMR